MRNLYYHIHFSPNVHSTRARGMYRASKKVLPNENREVLVYEHLAGNYSCLKFIISFLPLFNATFYLVHMLQ